MPTLHIRLLGDFKLLYADQQLTSLNTTRLRSLFAYLVEVAHASIRGQPTPALV